MENRWIVIGEALAVGSWQLANNGQPNIVTEVGYMRHRSLERCNDSSVSFFCGEQAGLRVRLVANESSVETVCDVEDGGPVMHVGFIKLPLDKQDVGNINQISRSIGNQL